MSIVIREKFSVNSSLSKTKEYNAYTDEELIASYKEDQDQLAWGILYERYYHLVYGVCLKYFKNKIMKVIS